MDLLVIPLLIACVGLGYMWYRKFNEAREYANTLAQAAPQLYRLERLEEAHVALKSQLEERTLALQGAEALLRDAVDSAADYRRTAAAEYEARLAAAMAHWSANREREIRADAAKRSKVVDHGFLGENWAPLLTGLPSKDFRHLGDPIDYLVCEGAEDVRAGQADVIKRVILMDIKTGKATLTTVQRRIRDAVVEGRVAFATYNPDTKTLRFWPEEEDDRNIC